MTDGTATSESAQSGHRVEWIDCARGIAIIAVVMYHSALLLGDVGWAGQWSRLMSILETLRMPLFFFVSGLLASRIRGYELPKLWSKRIALYIYIYILWSFLRWLYFQFVPWLRPSAHPGDVENLLQLFIWPIGSLWFIYALAIFSILVWVTKKFPDWVTVLMALVFSVAFSFGYIEIENSGWMKMGSYFLFFVLGVFFRSWAFAFSHHVSAYQTLLIVLAYFSSIFFYRKLGLASVPGAVTALSFLGVLSRVSLAIFISGFRIFSWVGYLGRVTLPIYVIQFMPLALIAVVLSRSNIPPPGAGAIVMVPLAGAASILISLGINRLVKGWSGIFDLPNLRIRRISTTG